MVVIFVLYRTFLWSGINAKTERELAILRREIVVLDSLVRGDVAKLVDATDLKFVKR